MGSGTSKKVTPTVLRAFRPEANTVKEDEERAKSKSPASSESSKSSGSSISERKQASEGWVVVDDGEKGGSAGQTKNRSPSPEIVEKPIGLEKAEGSGEKKNVESPACLRTVNNSKWPIRCFAKFDFNVNAHHGGCAALYFNSCAYGGKGEETTAEIFLVNFGFDCNHVSSKSVIKCHSGHFGAANGFVTDEEGLLIADCMFGTNHCMLMTNDRKATSLSHGMYAAGQGAVELPVNVNGTEADKGNGAGVTLVLCTGIDGGSVCNAVYMIRSGFKDSKFEQKIIVGEEKFKFNVDGDGVLNVSGPGNCSYGVFHNRKLFPSSSKALVTLTQTVDGKGSEMLLENVKDNASLMVLCSNSNGTEQSTVSSLYHIFVRTGQILEAKELAGQHGPSYTKSDLWQFEIVAGQLLVSGPSGPCKYAVLTNYKEGDDVQGVLNQDSCLATGEATKLKGQVKIDTAGVDGVVDMKSNIAVKLNHKIVQVLKPEDLLKENGVWRFYRKWTDEERCTGMQLIRVYAVRKHVQTGEDAYIELEGSPYTLIRQKAGVAYALNCSGPAYQAVNDITYTSEHWQFANFSFENNFGSQSLALGGVKYEAQIPQQLLKTFDGFLHISMRSPGVEAVDEKRVLYTVPDIKNGSYKLRVHMNTDNPGDLICNGKDYKQQLKQGFAKQKKKTDFVGSNCFYADVDVSVTNKQLQVGTKSSVIMGFALLDSTYKEKCMSEAQMKMEQEMKKKLANEAAQISVLVTRKALTIVGWSPNLLQNSSGQNGDLSHWNTIGDIKIYNGGGYGTEKGFMTSHMWCSRYQEVNLLDHFTAEYLDTAPEIQVSEWYREGVCGGGFYELIVKLLDEDGQVVRSYSTGEIGRIYRDNKWEEAAVTFSNYGPRVRIVAFTSKGKDDKFWAGHYGAISSAASVRVKRETQPANDDKFSDILDSLTSKTAEQEKLVSKILTDNSDLLQDMVDEEVIPVDADFEKQTKIAAPVKRKRVAMKKREIRVFVSSTFKDFMDEREEIIKKAFREINRICADRGVFFTYVDLRWGITSEQTSDGKTIAICLQEIDRCRPYFICLMGERFGWSQKTGNTDPLLDASYNYAIDNHKNLKWIDGFRYDSSVTELEIFHGVLNNPDAARQRSFFYMRKPPVRDELDEKTFQVRSSESEWHHERQEWLKSQIKGAEDLNITSFKSATEVSDLIKQDLTQCIDEDFPAGTELTKLQQQAEAHAAFAAVRCRVYIGREEYFTTINEQKDKQITEPFVLLGESGSGKSALVANWAKRVENAEPDTFMFVHFIGSSADSADYMKLIQRLYEEMKEYFQFKLEIPSSDVLLLHDLKKWLTLAGSITKVVIVLDALNQLDDGSGQDGKEHDLLWLPKELPHNVFMLLSTLPGRAMDACVAYGWPSIKVEPLDTSQKEQIITDYLEGIYGKALNDEQKQLIVTAKQTNNPLYLKSLLDEIRMYGSFRTLTDRIKDYLKAESPGDLFAKILERLEEDFEHESALRFYLALTNKKTNLLPQHVADTLTDKLLENRKEVRKSLIHDATTAIWCSNRGMSEAELVELLQVPSAVWSPFYLSLAENLVNRNGILNFFHDHLRQAVENKFLNTAEEKRKGYLRLADFFAEKEASHRTDEELPFLLTRAGELERLETTISDLGVFYRLTESEDGTFELIKAWKTLGDFSAVEPAYIKALTQIPKSEMSTKFEYHFKLFSRLGKFFLNLGLLEAAKHIYVALIKQLEGKYAGSDGTVVYNPFNQSWLYRCKHPDVLRTIQDLGNVYGQLGQHDEAVKVLKDGIARQNRIETSSQKLLLSEGLLALATVYVQQENMAEAKKLMIRGLELAIDVVGRKHHIVAAIFSKLGQLSYAQGRIDEALGYFLQDLKLTRSEVGVHHPRTAVVLNEIALVYDDKNDELAGQVYETALCIMMDVYGNNYIGTGIIRYNLGAFYFATNHFAMAKYQLNESYQIHTTFLGEDHADTKVVKAALDEVSKLV